MSLIKSLEAYLAKAERLEKRYEWLKTADLYKQALSVAGKKDFLKKGEVQEKIGRCFHHAAMQAASHEEFKQRMRQATESYEKAQDCYEQLKGEQKTGRILRCGAIVKRLSCWITSDPSEKRKLFDECLELGDQALGSFLESRNMLEYGRAYNEFKLVFWGKIMLEWDRQVRERLPHQWIKWGETAIAALSKLGNLHEAAETYFTLGVCWCAYGHRETPRKQACKYLSEAVDLSERVGDDLLLGMSHLWFGTLTDGEESVKHWKKALECGNRTQDHYLIARSLDFLAYMTYWKAYATEDPVQRGKLANEAMQLYDKAQHHFSIISLLSPRAGLIGWPIGYADHYFHLASWETDINRRRRLLEKSEKVGLEGLKLAESSGMPSAFTGALFTVASIFEARAHLEPKQAEKKKLLVKAMKYREKTLEILKELFTRDHWNRGVIQNALATIKGGLAEIEPGLDTKTQLLEEAISHKEECLKLCDKWINHSTKSVRFASLYHFQDDYATLLRYIYDLTGNPEQLRKTIDVSRKAIVSAKKLDMVSLMAESYWKIAKALGILGENLKAARNFHGASECYRLAAEKVPLLEGFYSEYASYMEAWAEIEKSRHEHENENYAQSREHYKICSRHLEMTKKWSYLSSYYFAWFLLEHGEELSRLDEPHDAMKAFDEARLTFGDSLNRLHRKVGELKNPEERDEVSKLATIARLRRQYCKGRVLMEEAKLSNRKGNKTSSAKKYASAAKIFKGIVPDLEKEEAGVEMQFAATLCQAWEKMQLAEEKGDAVLYGEAADLFARAGEISRRKTAGSIAMGHSCFCEALELGMKFVDTSNMDFYARAKFRMESAATYYRRAGFDKLALWVEATKRLFDAYVYAAKAEADAEPDRRVRFFLLAEKCLELSAKLYGKAGYLDRKNEALQSLERVRKERQLALSLDKVLKAPMDILSSTTGVSMPDSTEKAAGLKEFESVNIKARLSVPEEFIPGEEFQVKLDLINVGKQPGLLVRVEGLAPRRCKALRVPSYCSLEDGSLNLGGKRIKPLSVESINIGVQVMDVSGVSLSPQVVYVDESGNFRTFKVERAKILPVVEFESKAARVVFKYLVDAFVEDSVKRKLGPVKSGWRSLPQIMDATMLSKRSLYGAGGRLGPGLSELQRKGLVDLKVFGGQRGRGGHVLRVRIHYEKELVRKYVKVKAPDVSM